MTTSPHVALTFSDLDHKALQQIDRRSLGTASEIIQSSLMSYRLLVVNTVKQELIKKPVHTATELVATVELVSRLMLPRWTRLVAPSAISSYYKAYTSVGAGTVPPETIYALAEQHAERLGVYFNETSQEALAQGFNTLVNQKVPARAAAEQVLNAYGLTPRQMSGALALKAPEKTFSVSPRALKAKFNEYVGRSLRSRFKIFAEQEVHNLDLQAKQTAWMWMQDNGGLNETAQKVWLTARDEKVCPICGPMNGVRADIKDKFELPNGSEIWVPGVHPNCRCDVRVIQVPSELLQKDLKGPDLKEFNDEHPRGYHGRFGTKARTRTVFKPVGFVDEHPDVINREVIETTPTVGVPAPAMPVRAPTALVRSVGVPVAAPTSVAAPIAPAVAAPVMMSPAAPAVSVPAPGVATTTAPVVTAVQINTPVQTPEKSKLRNLTPYEEIKPLEASYYLVVSGPPGFHQFDQETFTEDRDQAIIDASEVRELAIDQMLNDHVPGEFATFKQRGSAYTVDLEARIPREEFRNILETIAQHTTSEYPRDAAFDVDFYDPDGLGAGHPMETVPMTALDITHAMGIDPDNLTVSVLQLNSIHTNDIGKGSAQYQKISGHTYGEYVITGDYGVTDSDPEYEPGTGTPNGMDIYEVVPFDPAVGYMEGGEAEVHDWSD